MIVPLPVPCGQAISKASPGNNTGFRFWQSPGTGTGQGGRYSTAVAAAGLFGVLLPTFSEQIDRFGV